MTSENQIEANRENALLSSGPETEAHRPPDAALDKSGTRDLPREASPSCAPPSEEGKKRSRLNALRHGLTGQVAVMTEEDRTAHDKFSKDIIKNLAPEGAMEVQLAQRIATDSWRLNRLSAIEDNIFALGFNQFGGEQCLDHVQIDAALTAARVFTQESKQLQLLSLYEQRLNRSVQKNLALLQSLQATRKAEQQAAMQEAKALLKLTEMKGQNYQPARDGFVFSNDQIHSAIDRESRLDKASKTDFKHYKPRKLCAQAA